MKSVWQRVARLFTTAADRSSADATDTAMMARCIALSREAVDAGEYPFACVIAQGDEVVVEADADEAASVASKVESVMVAAGEEYLKTVPVKVETEIADEWVK